MGFALRLCSRAMTAVLQPATLPMNDNDVTALAQADVARALAEDVGAGDLTAGLIDPARRARARILAREEAVICGAPWAEAALRALDPAVQITWHVQEGQRCAPDQVVLELQGNARALLSAERTALNFLQLLSAVATKTRTYVDVVAGTRAHIVDTRKTLPGLRIAQKYAVRAGGGGNHRLALWDAILIKENHIHAAGGIPQAVAAARAIAAQAAGRCKFIQVEVEDLAELEQALDAGVNMILLDNFSLENLRAAVRVNAGRAVLDLHPADTLAHSPWPLLAWPQGAPDKANVRDLQLALHRLTGTPLMVRGEFDVQRTDDRVEAMLRTQAGQLQLAATTGSTLDIAADWRPNAGAVATALLRIGGQPSEQPASLHASLPLTLIADIARTTGFDLPLTDVRGMIVLQATAELGEDSGTLRALNGEGEFVDAGAQAAVPGEPLKPGSASTFSLAGKLRFAWKTQQSTLELQPGLRWQASNEQVNASGQLEQPFVLTRTGNAIVSTGDLAVAWRNSSWGTWDTVVHDVRLDTGAALSDLMTAAARLRIKGMLPRWQHGSFALHNLRATGDAALEWSPDQGLGATLAAQLNPERLTLAGALPLAFPASTWKVAATAQAKPAANLLHSFTMQGIASSEKLQGEHAGHTVTLGSTRVRLEQFATTPRGLRADLAVETDAIRFNPSWPAPDLHARVRLDGDRVRSEGNVLLGGEEALRFAGSHALARACGQATFTAQHALATLGKRMQPRPPALMPLDLAAGEADASVEVDWCDAKVATKGTLHLRDARIGWEKAQAQDMQATLQLDGWQPLRGSLRLSAPYGQLATGSELGNLGLDLALTEDALQIRTLHLDLLGGSVHSAPITLPWPPTARRNTAAAQPVRSLPVVQWNSAPPVRSSSIRSRKKAR